MSNNDNKRVVRNTFSLYIRMFITLAISLISTRIILNALGFADNGLYNVVGGFVGFLSLLTAAVSTSISRFITYEIGKGNKEKVNIIFQNAICIQLIMALIVLVVGESIGLWFINNKLNYPQNRTFDVNVIYQFSLISFILGILSIAQNALIISHEKMTVYAYVQICAAIIKLIFCYIVAYAHTNKLILYAFLIMLISLGTRTFYTIYTKKFFPFCKYRLVVSKEYFRSMFSYSIWSGWGDAAAILRNSGISIVLNIFGGPIANTINGIANQVNGLASMFVSDFTISYKPQITKRYAAGDYDSLVPFIWRCSKFSFLLETIIAIPLLLYIEPIIIIWLKNVPGNTFIFIRLIIIFSLLQTLSTPLNTARLASINIRNYKVIDAGVSLLSLPLAYIFLKIGFPLYFAYIAMLISVSGVLIVRTFMLDGFISSWSSWRFIVKVLIPLAGVFVLCMSIPMCLKYLIEESFINNILMILFSVIWTILIVFYVGCSKEERLFILDMLPKKLLKHSL